MRLLLLAPFAPRLDADHGGGRAMAQILEELACRHSLAVLYVRLPGEPSMEEELCKKCDLVEEFQVCTYFSLQKHYHKLRRSILILRSLFTGVPYWAYCCRSVDLLRRFRGIVISWRPDIVQAEYHVMGQYLKVLEGISVRRVIRQYDLGARTAEELWRATKGVERIGRLLDFVSWRRFEPKVLSRSDALVVFTERDLRIMEATNVRVPIFVIPIGVSVPPLPLSPSGMHPPVILFVANFNHPPNVSAAERLKERIFPLVQRRYPEAQLWIVGEAPPARLQLGASPNVVITGRVPNVEPYLNRASVVVAPLELGGGMRVKVLEALAAGKALVASPLALEGLAVRDREHVLVARNDKEFIDAIIVLIKDPDFRIEIAEKARKWAVEHLHWRKVIMEHEVLYQRLLRGEERDLDQPNQ